MRFRQIEMWLGGMSRIPWEGRSPRDLTKGRKALFFRPEPQEDDCRVADGNQCDLFRAAITGEFVNS